MKQFLAAFTALFIGFGVTINNPYLIALGIVIGLWVIDEIINHSKKH